jgi:hypothetical protein
VKKLLYITVIAITVLLSVNSNFGQERDLAQEKKYAEDSIFIDKILQAESVSDAARDLRRKLEKNDIRGVLEAVKSCDVSLIPLLELLANRKSWYFADLALVRMGKTEFLKPMIDQTLPSEDWDTRYTAIKKLALTENKQAFKRLLELLDDSKMPKSIADDIALSPMSEIVMNELSEVVSNPPNLKGIYETDKRVLLWKKWFYEHKELTEGAETPKCDVNTTAKPIISEAENSYVKRVLFTDYLSIVLKIF